MELDADTPDRPLPVVAEAEGRLAALFGTVKAQLTEKHVFLAEGRVAIIDATVVEAVRTGRGQLERARPTAATRRRGRT
jgi:hypothetical protein